MCAAKSRRVLWTQFLSGQASGRTDQSALPVPHLSSPEPHLFSLKKKKVPAIVVGKSHFRGRILGIDPSLRGTGLAVVEVSANGICKLVTSRTLKLSPKKSLLACTGEIHEAVRAMIEGYCPDVCAAEQTIYVQNFQTAQIMGIARGAVLSAIARAKLELFEYAPLRIKQAVCGYGRASKEQVSRMVQALLGESLAVGFDETDAAAAALCCYFSEKELGTAKNA